MTKENAHLYLPLVQALVDGKTVECRAGDSWINNYVYHFSSPPERYRIKPEPVLVPLGPEDVPPGSIIRRHEWLKGWQTVNGVYATGVCFNGILLDWSELMDVYEIKRPGEGWKPCSKPSP